MVLFGGGVVSVGVLVLVVWMGCGSGGSLLFSFGDLVVLVVCWVIIMMLMCWLIVVFGLFLLNGIDVVKFMMWVILLFCSLFFSSVWCVVLVWLVESF